jgi:hypothetical protein
MNSLLGEVQSAETQRPMTQAMRLLIMRALSTLMKKNNSYSFMAVAHFGLLS